MKTVYIASSWKNEHAVVLLTEALRDIGFEVLSFVENNHGEGSAFKNLQFDDWCASESGQKSFEFDTYGATESTLVIYLAPSGQDAWAEVGAAWASGVPIYGLWAKGESVGLMRRMVKQWFRTTNDLLTTLRKTYYEK